MVRAREEGLIFADFEEGKINFAPTYKFDPGTHSYDTRFVTMFSFGVLKEANFAPCRNKYP